MATYWQALWAYRLYLIVLILPILLLPLPILIPDKVRTWGSGHREALGGAGEGLFGPGLGVLKASLTCSSLLAFPRDEG